MLKRLQRFNGCGLASNASKELQKEGAENAIRFLLEIGNNIEVVVTTVRLLWTLATLPFNGPLAGLGRHKVQNKNLVKKSHFL